MLRLGTKTPSIKMETLLHSWHWTWIWGWAPVSLFRFTTFCVLLDDVKESSAQEEELTNFPNSNFLG